MSGQEGHSHTTQLIRQLEQAKNSPQYMEGFVTLPVLAAFHYMRQVIAGRASWHPIC